MTVYLAGPITGLTYAEATEWRKAATEWLRQHGVTVCDPTATGYAICAIGCREAWPALSEIEPSLAGRIIASNALALRRAQAMAWGTPVIGFGACDCPVDIACSTLEDACQAAIGYCQVISDQSAADISLSALLDAIGDAVAYGVPTPAARFGLLSLLRHAVEVLEGEGDA